jgi:predicted outer membrane protein
MPRSFPNAARFTARAAWVLSLAGWCGLQSLGCSETTTSPIQASNAAPGVARENTHGPSSRGTVDAILQPGSVSEVEPLLTDSDITQLSSAANAGEIERGELARSKAQDPRVKKFAETVIDGHRRAQKEQSELVKAQNLTTAPSEVEAALRKELSELQAKLASETDFDRKYIELEVAQHRRWIDLFDRRLIPSAENLALKRSLREQRARIDGQLINALMLRMKLGEQARAVAQ